MMRFNHLGLTVRFFRYRLSRPMSATHTSGLMAPSAPGCTLT